jgi:hypothetical protein
LLLVGLRAWHAAPSERALRRLDVLILSVLGLLLVMVVVVAWKQGPSLRTPVALAGRPAAGIALQDEAAFLAGNEAAMGRMMAAMATVPSGDVDQDFVAAMVPHHQGAIDMAKQVLAFGHNELVRRLAQEIIVTQAEEIAALRLAVSPVDAAHLATSRAEEETQSSAARTTE